ncbi:MAG: T9SS type A sorting domain-containing protein [Candidatus Zixiibacteriota bacterium]|nr:MAG: T9SS type A sorting domain-containing protein [candidate division Zixibacteria bacterium]
MGKALPTLETGWNYSCFQLVGSITYSNSLRKDQVMKHYLVSCCVMTFAIMGLAVATAADDSGSGTSWQLKLERLGELIYFDERLSEPNGQSCASCHLPEAGFDDPDNNLPVSEGVIPGRFGNRNSPITAYAMFSPDFHYDEVEGLYVGGQFWDGRAVDLVEQAKGPFLNPLEMNNSDKSEVIRDILCGDYADLFLRCYYHFVGPPYGAPALVHNPNKAYDFVAEAIAAFERTELFGQFSSKYDCYLAGRDVLTEQELRGLELYEGKAQCNLCHPNRPGDDGSPALFTDFTYDNLGVPKNWDNPFLYLPPEFNPDGVNFIDYGLGGVLGLPEEMGKHKVMTLRNIAVSDPYLHNGYYKTLREVVWFYNARDVDDTIPDPEVPENVNDTELGNLGLTDDEVDDVVAFLQTLTDGYKHGPSAKLAQDQLPNTSVLRQNYPNPFNPTTEIAFTLPRAAHVKLEVFNIMGQRVETLINRYMEAGEHTASFDASGMATGMYVYRLQAGGIVESKKMLMVK